MAERLQKWLAGLGLGSRRQIEAWIAEGRITVDGKPAVLGQKVGGRETIAIDGRPVRRRTRAVRPEVIIYHKPVGEICTRADPERRPSVFAALPRPRSGRWIAVGRLDLNTSGLILFTTDGALAHGLMHPSAQLEREYAVRVQGEVAPGTLARLRAGVPLDDGLAAFAMVEPRGGSGRNRWYRVVVCEGRNRLVRRLWEAVGCRVSRLIRVRFGPVRLPRSLRRGTARAMTAHEAARLYRAAGLVAPWSANGATR